MFTNSHFALATHVLAVLTIRDEGPVTSAQLAQSINTNPAFLRALLGRLKKAGLVEVTLGKGGGAMLAKPAKKISLHDVYRAVDPEPERCLHRCEPNAECVVGRNITTVLDDVMDEVESAVAKKLARRNVQDVAEELLALG
ncbi:MAG: Rrf2 family transcriptional regulator [Deltaproteobacteria bacterium]